MEPERPDRLRPKGGGRPAGADRSARPRERPAPALEDARVVRLLRCGQDSPDHRGARREVVLLHVRKAPVDAAPRRGNPVGKAVSLAPGLHLGPYEILAPLGAGGMGEVYRARDTRLKRDVAV